MSAITAIIVSLLTAPPANPAPPAMPEPARYFRITVVDEDTGRGVPLVELRTVHDVRYYTDSAGVVAFYEPGLMGRQVYFHVRSHGYECPADGFGYRGRAIPVTEGGSAVLKIKRLNVAERLYRITGAGIYADSLLLGDRPPTAQPALNGLVFGQDSVINAIYHGRLYWFWGDTSRPAYPLGNFNVSGATSRLPADGGLDPALGVDLEYFVDDAGFAKQMAPVPGDGPTWIDGPVVLTDGGAEHMFAPYAKVRPNMETYQRGILEFDDEKNQFTEVARFELNGPIHPAGHPFRGAVDGAEYLYFMYGLPLVRVRADRASLLDQDQYEAFTCLKEGTRLEDRSIDRSADGAVVYAWKRRTPPLTPREEAQLVEAGLLKPAEALFQTRDVDTGKPITIHNGAVSWNRYRGRWVIIISEIMGTSMLGEVWYAAADSPLGPWVYARKIVTHDDYSFYNPKQHPYFEQERGRIVYFEGTYTATFSGNRDPTPRYNYNQIMYRLNLDDPRLCLPVAVYDCSTDGIPAEFATAICLRSTPANRPVAFFAPDHQRPNTAPVFLDRDSSGRPRLKIREGPPPSACDTEPPAFFAIPASTPNPPPATAPLYEFVEKDTGRRAYSPDESWSKPGFERAERPFCRVWPNPMTVRLPAAKVLPVVQGNIK